MRVIITGIPMFMILADDLSRLSTESPCIFLPFHYTCPDDQNKKHFEHTWLTGADVSPHDQISSQKVTFKKSKSDRINDSKKCQTLKKWVLWLFGHITSEATGYPHKFRLIVISSNSLIVLLSKWDDRHHLKFHDRSPLKSR
jgi:hypothetical protein